MNRNYVIINGVNSLTIKGLAINLMPPITKPLMRTMREEIDGRNGDINTELGYQAYDKQIEVGLYGNYDIDEIIAFFNSKGTIVFSDENDKFYNFQILDKIDFAKMIKFRTAMINMHCQPFKYPLTDTPVDVAYEYVESTGENLTLNNTEASSLKLDLKGNTTQTQTSGKNIYNVGALTTITSGGITFIPVYKDNDLQYIIVNGTANTNVFYQLNKMTLPAGSYILNGCNGGSTMTYQLSVGFSNIGRQNAVDGDVSFTLSEESTMNESFIRVQTGTNVKNVKIYPMIRLSSVSDSTYEPYTNGASPSPNWSQNINVVTGEQKINVSNSNLIGLGTLMNGYTNVNNFVYVEYATAYSYLFETASLPNTITFNATGGNRSNVAYYDVVPQVGTQGFRFESGNQLDLPRTISVNKEHNYILIQFSYDSAISNAQVNSGGSILPYEPYIGNTYSINLGKNLLKPNISSGTQNDVTCEYSNGGWLLNGLCSTTYTNFTIFSGRLEKGTYTINGITGASNTTYQLVIVKDGNAIGYVTSSNLTFTLTDNSNIDLRLYVYQAYGTFDNLLLKYQLEKGNVATSWSEYFTPIELCKIGTYQDKLFKSSGKNLLDTSELKDVLNENGASRKGFYFQIQKTGTYYVLFQSLNTQNILYCGKSIDLTQNTTPLGKNSTHHSFTYNFNEGEYFIIWGATDSDANDEIMLALSSEPIPYEPYGTNKWCLYKEIGKIILTGDNSENWQLATTYTNNVRYNSAEIKLGKTTSLISNYFLEGTGGTDTTNIDTNGTTGQLMITIPKTIAPTLSDFTTWLSTHNTIVYSQLDTPTTTEITEEQLIEQLNAIQNAVSYSGQTNITQDNSDKPFMIDATALEKGSDTAVLNNIGNIYSKPVIALQGTGIVNIYNDGVQAFQVDMSEENDITIDTEMMEAYTPTKLANRQVTGDYSKFMIDTGSHDVKFDGELTEATITRYVRWL